MAEIAILLNGKEALNWPKQALLKVVSKVSFCCILRGFRAGQTNLSHIDN
jgi:hypothetical protein